jgi:digeranylgeranylglycerophospholipid reductase
MSDYDVIIVGGGPAGSSTAETCAKLGLKVLMAEKRQEIGAPKRCGEGLTFDTEKLFGKKIPKRYIAQTVDGAMIYAPNKKVVPITMESFGGYVVERKVFDKWRAFEASRAGAYIQAKTEITDIIKQDDFVTGIKGNFDGDRFESKCKVLVAADGVESTIARKAGLDTTNQLININSGFQYEMSNLKLNDPHKIELYLGNEIAPRGYVWIFPKGEDVANVGIGIAMAEKSAKYYLNKFIKDNSEIFKNAAIIEVNSGGIPVGGLLKNMVLNGLVAVGDAAHQVNPIHGGGMKEGTIAGRIAGKVIKEAIDKNNVSQEALSKYNDLWWDERGNSLKKVEKLRQIVEKLNDNDFNDLAETLKPEDIVEFTKGSKLSTLAKILMRKPRLIGLVKHLL